MDRPDQRPLTAHLARLRADARLIAAGALESASAARLLDRALTAPPSRHFASQVGSRAVVHLIAAGKAAPHMARALLRRYPGRVSAGLVTGALGPASRAQHPHTAPGTLNPALDIEEIPAAHPLPAASSVTAGQRALALASTLPEDGVLVLLLSGGASAMLAVPAEGLALEDKVLATRALLSAGAPIHQLNCIRKHLSAIKGGWLAARCPGWTMTFAISDVIGPTDDDPSVIGSGPTVPDPTTFRDALVAIESLGCGEAVPVAVRARLARGARGEIPETPKPGDPRLARSELSVIGGLRDAIDGAAREAAARGYRVIRLAAPVTGEAREAAPRYLAAVLAETRDGGAAEPVCVLSGGETTVRVIGGGRGGRNQEFAMALADALARADQAMVVASVGTDGVDGPTDAAGAIVDGATTRRARDAGLKEPAAYLAANDAYSFFEPLGDLIRTGPTGTNVGDIQICLMGGLHHPGAAGRHERTIDS